MSQALCCSAAPQTVDGAPAARVDVSLQEVQWDVALEQIGKATGLRIVMAPPDDPDLRISLSARTADELAEQLGAQTGRSCDVRQGVLVCRRAVSPLVETDVATFPETVRPMVDFLRSLTPDQVRELLSGELLPVEGLDGTQRRALRQGLGAIAPSSIRFFEGGEWLISLAPRPFVLFHINGVLDSPPGPRRSAALFPLLDPFRRGPGGARHVLRGAAGHWRPYVLSEGGAQE